MRWDINVKNKTDHDLILLDFQLPLCFNTAYARAWQKTYLRRGIRHSFVAGNGSFIFLNKAGGDPPFLLMMPISGTSVDCFDVETTHDAGRGLKAFTPFICTQTIKTKIKSGDCLHPIRSSMVAIVKIMALFLNGLKTMIKSENVYI